MNTQLLHPPAAQGRHVVHRFVADHLPTPWDIHCWCTQQTNKQPMPFKVLRNGKVLGLVCAEGAVQPHSITQASGHFRFLRTEPAPAFGGQAGDIASISLRLSYAVSRRNAQGKKFTQSPWDTWGRIQPGLQRHLMAYLEQHTGLTGLVDGSAQWGLQAVALPQAQDPRRRVWLSSVADIGIRARIANAATFQALAYGALGNHRSYGLGSVACDGLEPALAALQPAHAQPQTTAGVADPFFVG